AAPAAGPPRPPPGRRARRRAAAPAAGPPRPPQRLATDVQLVDACRHGGLPHTRGSGHQPDPAVSKRPRLRGHQQPPLPLVEMRRDRLELRRQQFPGDRKPAHTRGSCRILGIYGIFSGKPLSWCVRSTITALLEHSSARTVLSEAVVVNPSEAASPTREAPLSRAGATRAARSA